MSYEIITATIQHYEEIELRPYEREELAATPQWFNALKMAIEEELAFTILVDGEVIAICGFSLTIPGVAEVWMMTGVNVEKHWRSGCRAAQQVIAMGVECLELHRLQSIVHEKHIKAARFVEWLGFEREGLMKAFSADKKNYYLYAMVR